MLAIKVKFVNLNKNHMFTNRGLLLNDETKITVI